jgi:cell wall-associated NlpC family hydrolase
MKVFVKGLASILILNLFLFFSGCDGGGSSSDPLSPNPTPTGEEFADTVIDTWLGVDYSLVGPDGFTDTDDDGQVDTDDAVNFFQTFRDLGYDIPATTIQGLYENYYTASGNNYPDDDSLTENTFNYTKENSVSEADLQAADWSGLTIGDLIFVDYDKDSIWDYAAVYLGAYGSYSHAVITASDYWDEVVIMDLDYYDSTPDPDKGSIIRLDIAFGHSDVRTPDYDNIADY